jgi:hypothetical protein
VPLAITISRTKRPSFLNTCRRSFVRWQT